MRSRYSQLRSSLVAIAVLPALIFGSASAIDAARPPVGKTYYTVLMGLASPYDVSTSCFEFDVSSVCSTDGGKSTSSKRCS